MKINGRINEETWDLLQGKEFNLMTMHIGKESKAIVLACEKEKISGMDYNRIMLLSLEYINAEDLCTEDLNDTITTGIMTYFDSEQYKKGLPYRNKIKR